MVRPVLMASALGSVIGTLIKQLMGVPNDGRTTMNLIRKVVRIDFFKMMAMSSHGKPISLRAFSL